ncbi:MAG: hypothetical protein EA423_04125 [Phycisphaerales bacterium]|nr:MAG: hypothetical protein EA423_04125 [Phycisphaerales bacterium]
MRVLIVDSSAFVRQAVARMLSEPGKVTVCGYASDPATALGLTPTLRPDAIVTLGAPPDLSQLDAMTATGPERTRPPVCVFVWTGDRPHRDALFQMRRCKAGWLQAEPEKLRAADPETGAKLLGEISRLLPPNVAHGSGFRLDHPNRIRLVLVGSSTGGPVALEEFLSVMPSDLGVPIVIAQHMPPLFTKGLGERLGAHCPLDVEHVTRSAVLNPRTVYIIQGGKHGRIGSGQRGMVLTISEDPPEAPYKPSVDILFSTAAKTVGRACLGVVLTGMGEDGAKGAKDLTDLGAQIIVQHEKGCAVYGMPRAVASRGMAAFEGSPRELGQVVASVRPGASALRTAS